MTDDDLTGEYSQPTVTPIKPQRFDISRFLRSCAGIDEAVLATVPTERHRYAGVGGIVLGTSVLAFASMTLALSLIVDEFKAYFLLGPMIWGLFVFNLDRWLVASTHGISSRLTLLPRVALAGLFGFIIAEPVVLWVFGDAIEEHIADERKESFDQEADLLVRCNPDEPDRVSDARALPECEGFVLQIDAPASNQRMETLTVRIADLDSKIGVLDEQITETSDRLQREVRGDPGADTSGRSGEGPIVRNLRTELTSATEARDKHQTDVDKLNDELKLLEEASGESAQSYSERIADLRSDRLAELEAQQSGRPGLLLRFDALSELASQNFHINAAQWLLRAFLVAVDLMPVLAKGISSKSSYDRILSQIQTGAEDRERRREVEETDNFDRKISLRKYKREKGQEVEQKKAFFRSGHAIRKLEDEYETAHRPSRRTRRSEGDRKRVRPSKPTKSASTNGATSDVRAPKSTANSKVDSTSRRRKQFLDERAEPGSRLPKAPRATKPSRVSGSDVEIDDGLTDTGLAEEDTDQWVDSLDL